MGETNQGSTKPVLIFDMNETLLDLATVRQSVAAALGGDEDVVSLWFETMLHYSLVDTVSGQYHNFGEIGVAALTMLADVREIAISNKEAQQVLAPIKSSPPYPEVPAALKRLEENKFRLAVLTNSSNDGLNDQLEYAQIRPHFEQCMSVEDAGKYKPHTAAYRWAANQLNIAPEDCLFIAAHGWDVTGAMAAGMKAAFIARSGQSRYPLTAEPAFIEHDLKALSNKLINFWKA